MSSEQSATKTASELCSLDCFILYINFQVWRAGTAARELYFGHVFSVSILPSRDLKLRQDQLACPDDVSLINTVSNAVKGQATVNYD